MVRVKVEARSFSMAMCFDCEDHELDYFIIDDTKNTSRAREYLQALYDTGHLNETSWSPAYTNDELEITVKELGICYILAKEQTDLVPESLTPQLQEHQPKGKGKATVTSGGKGIVHPTQEAPVNLDETTQEEHTAHKGKATVTSGGKVHPTQEALVNLNETTQEEHTAHKDHIRPCFSWSDSATKFLINAYKERKDLFCNKSIKKATLWKEITTQLTINGFGNPSIVQVEDKFKNLRRIYAKHKDAMGPGCSGQPALGKFKYHDEMDEIFAKNPQFDPPLVVGSRRKINYTEDMENEPEINKKKPNKAKPNVLETVLEAQSERHREILKEIRLSRETFAEKLDKLIEKL